MKKKNGADLYAGEIKLGSVDKQKHTIAFTISCLLPYSDVNRIVFMNEKDARAALITDVQKWFRTVGLKKLGGS